ncbi:MAG: ATP-binding protein, partial [Bacteroidota bacterium]
GIFVIRLKKSKFTVLTSENYKSYSARGVVEDPQGTIHVNTYQGRIQIHLEHGTIKKAGRVRLGATRDKAGNLWFSGQNSTIECHNTSSGEKKYYEYNLLKDPDQQAPAPERQWAILCDTEGHIWTGTHRGVYTLDPETCQYRKFTQYNAFPQLGESTVYHLHEDKAGIWIASSSGLYLLEPGKGITARYAKTENTPYHIPYDHLLHFHRDEENILWLATQGGGLIRLDPQNGDYRQFTTADGLSDNTIYAVYEDDYSKLWLPSNYGLMQFDKKNHKVNTYLKGDGIAHEEFNTASHYRTTDGRLYFGGLAGVIAFYPQDFVTEASTAAPLHMTNCQILHKKTGAFTDKTQTVLNIGKLELAPSENSFILTFALLNYENAQKNSYAYTIEGLDKEWTTIQENRLRINTLPYGNYTLYIKGQGIQGVQAANQLAIPIVVHAPFYRKNWFIIISIFTLGLLMYGMFYWRLQRLKKTKIRLEETIIERTQEIRSQKDEMEKDKNTIEHQAEHLKALNATQSRWFTNIAHELRTPLTLVLGPLRQFLNMHSGKPKAGIEHIKLAERNSTSLLRLVNEILDISKLEADRLELRKEPTGLTQLVKASVAHFDSLACQKDVLLTSRIQDDINITIDKDRIQKILVNLISNALKFTHAGGRVVVSVHHEKKQGVTISVNDTGDGIPEKDLPHIFERYYQVSDPEKINQGGTGIGLALALELAKLHGGTLSVESKTGKGSRFTLSLPENLIANSQRLALLQPIVPEPVRPLPWPASLHNITNRQSVKPHVLLVEDNPDMRQYVLGIMTPAYEVVEVGDGIAALEHLKKTTPDLIISDIMMPRMDGITLAKMLKKEDRLKTIPFITLTAKADKSDKIAALRIGIDDYLTKPFNAEELEARAANLIRNYRERQAISKTDSEEIPLPTHQDKVVTAMKDLILEQLENSTFTLNDLASSQNMSLSTLKRFLKKATGLTPGQFIREIRLQQARKLLETRQYPTVLEVVHAVGFENASYFTRLFSERFGKKPSAYL